jgi:hypothetical protein
MVFRRLLRQFILRHSPSIEVCKKEESTIYNIYYSVLTITLSPARNPRSDSSAFISSTPSLPPWYSK